MSLSFGLRLVKNESRVTAMTTPSVRRRSLYMSTSETKHHKGKRALYLVERLDNSPVFAKFTSLGYVNSDAAESEAQIALMHYNMTTTGEWKQCDSRRNQRTNVILGTDYEEVE